jgi:hypothetical protein
MKIERTYGHHNIILAETKRRITFFHSRLVFVDILDSTWTIEKSLYSARRPSGCPFLRIRRRGTSVINYEE